MCDPFEITSFLEFLRGAFCHDRMRFTKTLGIKRDTLGNSFCYSMAFVEQGPLS